MSTETYTFTEAEPVKRAGRQGAGRKAEPNPFESAVADVIGQTREDGRPKTAGTSFQLDAVNGETLKQRAARIRRFLTRASKTLAEVNGDERYDIRMSIFVATDEIDTETGQRKQRVANLRGEDADLRHGEFSVRFWHRPADAAE